MRANTFIINSGSVVVFPVDYLNPTLSLQIVPSGGCSVLAEMTLNDPNNTDRVVTTTWFPMAAPFNAAISAAGGAIGNVPLFPLRALRFTASGGGSAQVTVLQGSGLGNA
jgi:hypothetical protein